jgi:hypothetical protein
VVLYRTMKNLILISYSPIGAMTYHAWVWQCDPTRFKVILSNRS